MKILMLGWDFPPIKNGGLGVACLSLTEALSNENVDVLFVLPYQQDVQSNLPFIFAEIERAELRKVDSPLLPYRSSNTYFLSEDEEGGGLYAHSLIEEVYRYAAKVCAIARREKFDIIHAHDWTSYMAGVAAKRETGKPLILHVHATSFDQSGGQPVDPEIYKIEQKAFEEADRIVAISNYTSQMLIEKHGVDPYKIEIIHNGAPPLSRIQHEPTLVKAKELGKKIVLYHGRITVQKGVDYFVRAAKRVLEYNPNVIFVISGWGDMEPQIMRQVSSMGMSSDFIFAGPLWGEERDRIYQNADLLVMPSVSEPFGLTPVEALAQGTPVLISKQSGVSEVLKHALKVDFWDTDEMANQILAALAHEPLHRQLRDYGREEIKGVTWQKAAQKCVELYKKVLSVFKRN